MRFRYRINVHYGGIIPYEVEAETYEEAMKTVNNLFEGEGAPGGCKITSRFLVAAPVAVKPVIKKGGKHDQ